MEAPRVQNNIWNQIMNESIFIEIERFLCWNPLSQGLMFILNAKFEFSYDVSAQKYHRNISANSNLMWNCKKFEIILFHVKLLLAQFDGSHLEVVSSTKTTVFVAEICQQGLRRSTLPAFWQIHIYKLNFS